jgi:threonine dehydrogenase-like Zn-dependent dehydrogenase
MPKMPPYGDFIFGHEYAGDVVALGRTVDEFRVGDRVVVEAHMGCRRCENCIRGLYTACLNYGNTWRGHRSWSARCCRRSRSRAATSASCGREAGRRHAGGAGGRLRLSHRARRRPPPAEGVSA